jgi:hypothetical protein
MSLAAALELRTGDQERLEAVLRKPASDDHDVLRAGIILLCAQGIPPREIQRQLHTSLDSVARWRGRYEAMGMAGLRDAPRTDRRAGSPVGANEPDRGRGRAAVAKVAS